MHSSTDAPSQFSPVELARLARYRAAIQAGLYTDHGLEADPTATPAWP